MTLWIHNPSYTHPLYFPSYCWMDPYFNIHYAFMRRVVPPLHQVSLTPCPPSRPLLIPPSPPPSPVIKKLKKYVDDPVYMPETVAKQSRAAMSLCMWSRAMDVYHRWGGPHCG